jgi:asparagine synthase (glutamine-hydrolysing)
MCGIFGTTDRLNVNDVQRQLLRFKHRGPDAQRQFQDNQIVFGHNRLSILDLDERAHQPFIRDNDVLVFNGEIYNFYEIKQQLQAQGSVFETTSDTEVLLKAYQRWGDSVVSRLNGMFSFVIYDHKRQRFFGARDRFGKKPFYYRLDGEDFSFSSNLYALVKNGDQESEEALNRFFWFGYIPDDWSIINGINKLLPAHAFQFDLQTRKMNTWCYWELSATSQTSSYSKYLEQLDALLLDAVKIRMVADVPVGVFLSGGIDSSLVTQYAKQLGGEIKTFSIGFNESQFDESFYAEQVANKLGTVHKTIPCSSSELYQLIENYSHFFDEPFADASAIPTLLLAQKTKDYVTVALSGDGGDEIFYGYTRYKWFYWIEKVFSMPRSARKVILSLLQRAYPERGHQWRYLLSSLNKEEAYLRFMGSVHGLMEMPSGLMSDDQTNGLNASGNFILRMANWDVMHYMPNDILTKVDRATMAYSLEARSPLLDYRLAELTRSQPVHFNFSPFDSKKALKQLLNKNFSNEFLNRKKQGFTLPLKAWLRNELREEVNYWVYESGLIEQLSFYDVGAYRKRVEAHMAGETNFYPEIWKLMVYGRWRQHFSEIVS